MRALIIGGGGAIGSAVARHASSIGIETHVGLRTTTNPDRLLGSPGIRRHVLELSSAESMVGLVEATQPDWIVMAAFPSESRAASSLARRNLLMGMSQGLLGVMEALGSTGFSGMLTWIGSAMCYGRDGAIQRCTDRLRPASFRGAVKSAESMLAAQMAAEFGLALTELRVFTGFGPYEQRGRLVSRLLRAGLLGGSVPLTPTAARRDWIHYDDIARACVATAARSSPGHRVFNACSGVVHDTHQVARLLEEITGRRLVADHSYDHSEFYGDALPGELPQKDDGLEWGPCFNLGQGLEHTWRWACSSEGRRYLLQDAMAIA